MRVHCIVVTMPLSLCQPLTILQAATNDTNNTGQTEDLASLSLSYTLICRAVLCRQTDPCRLRSAAQPHLGACRSLILVVIASRSEPPLTDLDVGICRCCRRSGCFRMLRTISSVCLLDTRVHSPFPRTLCHKVDTSCHLAAPGGEMPESTISSRK